MSAERKQAKQADPTSTTAPATQQPAKMGRPRAMQSAEALQQAIDAYFDSLSDYARDSKGNILTDPDGNPIMIEMAKPPTSYGLALALGVDRKTLYKYGVLEEIYPDYVPIVAHARDRINAYRESRLYDRDGARGAEFALLNSGDDWAKRETIDVTTTHTVALPEQDVKALGAVISQWQQLQSAAQAAQQIAGGPVIDVVAEPVEPPSSPSEPL